MLDFLLSDSVLHFDLSVFQAVEKLWNPILDAIMMVITNLGEGGIIWIVLALILFCTKKYRKAGFSMMVALVVMVLCNDLALKNMIARPRPFNLDIDWWNSTYIYPDIVSRPDSFSFPSGHSSSSFAAAFALLWYDRKFGIPATVFAVIMAFSRVYVHVHYCTDVVAGAIVGFVYAVIGIFVAKLLFTYVDRIADNVFEKIKKKKAE